jgi:hypothetical protein
LNVLRIRNQGVTRNLTVKAPAVGKGGQPLDKSLSAVAVPAANDLAVTVAVWNAVDLQAQAVPF